MSTTLARRPLQAAQNDAILLRCLFEGCYEEWHFAGSVRRGAREVGDVEHVVRPRVEVRPVPGTLFGGTEEVNLMLLRSDELVASGRIAKHFYGGDGASGTRTPGPRWGTRYRGADFRGFCHELFMSDPDGSNLGPTLAIRTGPGGYSRMLVTQLQRHGHINMGGYVLDKRRLACTCGWSGADKACRWEPGVAGRAIVKDPDGRDGGPFGAVCPGCGRSDGLSMPRVPVPTEAEYFALCGVPFEAPELRREPI